MKRLDSLAMKILGVDVLPGSVIGVDADLVRGEIRFEPAAAKTALR